MTDPLKPSVRVLARLGSAVVHAQEIIANPATAMTVNQFDWVAFSSLVSDPEVKEWFAEMEKKGLVVAKR